MHLKLVLAAMITFIANHSSANIALRGKNFSPTRTIQNSQEHEGVEKDFSTLTLSKKDRNQGLISYENIEMMIPLDLKPSSDSVQIEGKIRQHFLSNLAKSPKLSKFGLFRSLQKASKKMENVAEISVKKKNPKKNNQDQSAKNPETTGEEEISHKINLKLQAFKQEAKLMYKGYIDSTLTYQQAYRSVTWSTDKKLSDSSKLQLVYKNEPVGTTQLFRYLYNW